MDLTNLNNIDPQNISVAIDRGMCHGTCPSYRLTLKASGELIFKGRAWVDVEGVVKTTVDPEKVLAFVKILLDMNFFEIADLPPVDIKQPADYSTTMIILKVGDKKKCIATSTVGGGFGLDIEQIATDIDKAFNTARWIENYRLLP